MRALVFNNIRVLYYDPRDKGLQQKERGAMAIRVPDQSCEKSLAPGEVVEDGVRMRYRGQRKGQIHDRNLKHCDRWEMQGELQVS